MHLHQIAFVACLCAAAVSSTAVAQQSRNQIYAGLDRVADTAARLETTFCDVDLARTFQGAIDGINAMPERSAEPPLSMREPGLESFARVYSELLESAENRGEIERGAINGMIHVYDATGEWKPADEVWRTQAAGGILVVLDGSGDTPLVIRTIDEGPAQRVGIRSGDRLIEIDGQPTAGLRLYQVVQKLRGAIGSDITVVVERNGASISFSMQRAAGTLRPVQWRVEGNIGIITVDSFQEHSAAAVRDAIRDIQREVRRPIGYVIDLRDNAGGLLDQVIEAADYFIDGGVVTTVRAFAECHPGDTQTYRARRRDATDGAPLVVLVNGNTASGAEMMAAALKERRNATLVGQRTLGNARVHTVIPMSGGRGGFLRLSTGVLTSPSGFTWDQSGLTPDVTAEPRNGDADPAMDAAIRSLSGAP